MFYFLTLNVEATKYHYKRSGNFDLTKFDKTSNVYIGNYIRNKNVLVVGGLTLTGDPSLTGPMVSS